MNYILNNKFSYAILTRIFLKRLEASFVSYAQSIAIHHHFGYCFQTSSKDFIK